MKRAAAHFRSIDYAGQGIVIELPDTLFNCCQREDSLNNFDIKLNQVAIETGSRFYAGSTSGIGTLMRDQVWKEKHE